MASDITIKETNHALKTLNACAIYVNLASEQLTDAIRAYQIDPSKSNKKELDLQVEILQTMSASFIRNLKELVAKGEYEIDNPDEFYWARTEPSHILTSPQCPPAIDECHAR